MITYVHESEFHNSWSQLSLIVHRRCVFSEAMVCRSEHSIGV